MPVNTGDTAWILVSAALVMLMTPGLALFYGGMVRRKNVLSTMMMSFAMLGLVGILWVFFGYSFSFAPGGGFIGGLDFLGLNNVGQAPSPVYAPTVPHLAFMIYQAMFAIITVALFTGAVVDRIKFSSLLIFAALWLTLIYTPVAHWIWGGGWLAKMGVMDFAGGAVVHINAGVSALALAMLLGPRKGFPEKEPMEAHNIPLVMLGAGILWFGWFGFNAGSALTSGGLAASAFVATNTSGAAAALTWMLLSWIYRRPTALGTVTGAIIGLAAVTPAAGFIAPIMGVPIGIGASVIGYYSMLIRGKSRVDDSLDVLACHGMGGLWGVLATGVFASLAVNAAGANGLIFGNVMPVLKQLVAIVAVGAYAFAGTMILGKLVDVTIGLRVTRTEETLGLDISQHGERAYGGVGR
jgi:Amt family ammonium transporter